MTLLEARGLTVRYGGVVALDDVWVSLDPGQITALVGANGAGKTTLLECIGGATVPDAGRVFFEGQDLHGCPPADRAQLGIIRSFADARLFPSLTVEQALLLAHERTLPTGLVASMLRLPSWRAAEARRRRGADHLLDVFGLVPHADKLVAELSAGLRRALDLACCVALQPKVLLLDEPSAGLAQAETAALADTLLRVRALTDAAMLVIEHDLPLAMSIADYAVVLEAGAVKREGTPAQVRRALRPLRRRAGTSRSGRGTPART